MCWCLWLVGCPIRTPSYFWFMYRKFSLFSSCIFYYTLLSPTFWLLQTVPSIRLSAALLLVVTISKLWRHLRIALIQAVYSLQCSRFLCACNLLAKAPCWNFPKRRGNGASQRERGGSGQREEKTAYFFSPLPLPPFLLSPSRGKGYYFYSP